jgi:hypothetical protein
MLEHRDDRASDCGPIAGVARGEKIVRIRTFFRRRFPVFGERLRRSAGASGWAAAYRL